jgi:hypothetical protein
MAATISDANRRSDNASNGALFGRIINAVRAVIRRLEWGCSDDELVMRALDVQAARFNPRKKP